MGDTRRGRAGDPDLRAFPGDAGDRLHPRRPAGGAAWPGIDDRSLAVALLHHDLAARIDPALHGAGHRRSEEHTSELPSLMRTSYAVFCLTNKTNTYHI